MRWPWRKREPQPQEEPFKTSLTDDLLYEWRLRLWKEASQPLMLHHLHRVLHVGPLPLPWPEFNRRAKDYFRAKCQKRRVSVYVGVDLAHNTHPIGDEE